MKPRHSCAVRALLRAAPAALFLLPFALGPKAAQAQPCYRYAGAPCVPLSLPVLPTGAGSAVAPAGTGDNPLAHRQVPTRTAPSGGNVSLGTTAATVIPAASMAGAVSAGYQVQGSGYACVSWVSPSVTISGAGAGSTCGGSGAFLVTAGSTERTGAGAVPSTALTAVAAAGASLSISWQVQ